MAAAASAFLELEELVLGGGGDVVLDGGGEGGGGGGGEEEEEGVCEFHCGDWMSGGIGLGDDVEFVEFVSLSVFFFFFEKERGL